LELVVTFDEKAGGIPESVVQRAAHALYELQIKAAGEEVKKIKVGLSELPELFERLKEESETGKVLIFASYIDRKVTEFVRAHLFHLDSKSKEDEIFGSNGPLGTFGSRLALSYHLGWLSVAQRNRLDAFRKIRNEFAHNAFKVKLSDPMIVSLMSKIKYDLGAFLDRMRSAGTPERPHIITPIDEITREQETLAQFALLAMHTAHDYLILHIARLHNVRPNDLAGSFGGDSPVLDVNRAVVTVILGLFLLNRAELNEAYKSDASTLRGEQEQPEK
jgi:hypothetical protein